MKKAIKAILFAIIFSAGSFGLFLLYITVVDFRPGAVEVLYTGGHEEIIRQDTFRLISWNIGYCGLGSEMDFFYDGGEQVRPTSKLARKYRAGIMQFIREHKGVDFWLLQEVDTRSKRSYGINQLKRISEELQPGHAVYAKNYIVPYVPVPIKEPMGHVNGGILNFSAFTPALAERYAYPLIASWPEVLFLLDRCFILSRYKLEKGNDLVILNTHNSAYVIDSALRRKELDIIKNKMLEEYAKGNYVVAGGDWNANPPGLQVTGYFNGHYFKPSKVKMAGDLLPPGWTWAYDVSAPTNRDVTKPYVKGESETTVIDYFIVSPNVGVVDIETIDLGFENSDHNPVTVKVVLK